MPKGITRIEIAISAGLILLLGGAMWLGVRYAGRLSRDAARLSSVRQAQAGLESFRLKRLAYPSSDAPDAPKGFTYRALPEGCAPGTEAPCVGYELAFILEGRVGTLAGGDCTAKPDGLACTAAK